MRRAPGKPARRAAPSASDLVRIHTDRIETEELREAGPVHVGPQMWKKLGVNSVLAEAGLSPPARQQTEVMTLNRLIDPASEHAMPDWVRRTPLGDILGTSFEALRDDAL